MHIRRAQQACLPMTSLHKKLTLLSSDFPYALSTDTPTQDIKTATPHHLDQ
jgi:hypothetical protein